MSSHHGSKEAHLPLKKWLPVLVAIVALIIGLGLGYGLRGSGEVAAEAEESSGGAGVATAADSHSAAGESASHVKTLYTCGMHPEVISDKPGVCPKCGMKLTPMDPDRARMILEARGESVPDTETAASDPATGKDPSAGKDSTKKRKILYWRAPMDPTYIRDKPGKSPMGMDLVPVYADEVSGGPTIRIDPVTEQDMGLRYDYVRLGPLDKTIRTVGTVTYDEQGLGTVTTKVNGWVEKVYIDVTGTQVHKGDPLFEFYSPELYSAEEEYLIALRDANQAKEKGVTDAARLAQSRLASARDRLRLFDITDKQIQDIENTGKIRKTLTITAQLTGIVTHKNVVQGDFLKAGAPAYKIADLSTVWVMGMVYESDMPYVRLGQEAQMELDYLPGRVYRGRVTYIYPYLEAGTREIPVRMEFHNPGYDLKPGMYATIRIQSDLEQKAVLVPAMAVIDTGERKVVFVMRGPGKFEPRKIVTGVRTDSGELQVLSGLAPGEQVVVSGQFLLDSESNLREATLKMLHAGAVNTTDFMNKGGGGEVGTASKEVGMEGMSGMKSMKGMKGAEQAGSEGSVSAAATSSTMSMASMSSAPTAPAHTMYVCPMPSHAGILYDHPGNCPLCGMKLVPVQPWQMDASPVAYYTCPMPEHYYIHEKKPGKCPICGMTLIPVTVREAKRFAAIPKNKLPIQLYTCPMPIHADVVMDHPGVCPKCGMKLVPVESVPHGREAVRHWMEEHPTTGTLEKQGAAVPAGKKFTLYTCPMDADADVVSDKPGRCPRCGMKLVDASETDHAEASEKAWRKRMSHESR